LETFVNIRRFAWIMMLSAGVVLLLTYFMNPKPAPQAPPASPTTAATGPSTQEAQVWSYQQGLRQTVTLGSSDPESPYTFTAELSTLGAGVADLRLAHHFATVEDKRLFDKLGDEQLYRSAVAENPQKYRGHYSLLRPIEVGGKSHLPYATRKVVISMPRGSYTFDLGQLVWQLDSPAATAPATAPTTEPAQQTASFVWTLERLQQDSAEGPGYAPVLRLRKTYSLRPGEHSMRMSLAIENLSGEPMKVAVDQFGPMGLAKEAPQDMRAIVVGQVNDEGKVDVVVESEQRLSEMTQGVPWFLARWDRGAWVGEVNRYFASIIHPMPPAGTPLDSDYLARYYALRFDAPDPQFAAVMSIGARYESRGGAWAPVPELEIAAGATRTVDFDIFAGPKREDLFSAQASPMYARLNYVSTINFGSGCPCAWDWLAMAMVWLLNKLSWLMLGNYGLAIMLLVLLTRLVLHPLTKKSQISMMRMQKLAPRMAELKEKYKDDKDTLQRETVKLYKEQGAGPLLGCLPMLLQMPIWIALWSALSTAVELRHAPFLPVWLTDLAAPDAVLNFAPFSIPLISGFTGPIHSLNVLPLLLTLAMYFQTKLNPASAGPTTPEQAMQQKMMRVMMPGMMLLFFYNQASGLTLYVMVSTAAGVVEQMVIKKHIQQREAQAAQVETRVSAPGKGFRGSRPKKPKGPFWFKR
jgi:YidC/Oxa1 family membrane protein insertase